MEFDQENNVIQLCIKGMDMELHHKPAEAKALFLEAWNAAGSDLEKFTAAHYVARHQPSVSDKLKWDKTALSFALKIHNDSMKANLPSLYLNIAKCYEDLNDKENAYKNYQVASSYAENLPANEYGKMIEAGIKNGIQRVS